MASAKQKYQYLRDALDRAVKTKHVNPMSSEIDSVEGLVRAELQKEQETAARFDTVLAKAKEESAKSPIKLSHKIIATQHGYDEQEHKANTDDVAELHAIVKELETQRAQLTDQ